MASNSLIVYTTDCYQFEVRLTVERYRFEDDDYLILFKNIFEFVIRDLFDQCKYNFGYKVLNNEEDTYVYLHIQGWIIPPWVGQDEFPLLQALRDMPLEDYIVGEPEVTVNFTPNSDNIAIFDTTNKNDVVTSQQTEAVQIPEHTLKNRNIFDYNRLLHKQDKENYKQTLAKYTKTDKEIVAMNNIFHSLLTNNQETRAKSKLIVQHIFPSLIYVIRKQKILFDEHLENLINKNISLEDKATILWSLYRCHDIQQRLDKLCNNSDIFIQNVAKNQNQTFHEHTLLPAQQAIINKLLQYDEVVTHLELHNLIANLNIHTTVVSSLEQPKYVKASKKIQQAVIHTNKVVATSLSTEEKTIPDTLAIDLDLFKSISFGEHNNTVASYNRKHELILMSYKDVKRIIETQKKEKIDPCLTHEIIHHYQQKHQVLAEGNFITFNKIMEGITESTTRHICRQHNIQPQDYYESYVQTLDCMTSLSLTPDKQFELYKTLNIKSPRQQMELLAETVFGTNNLETRKAVEKIFLEAVEKNEKNEREKNRKFVYQKIIEQYKNQQQMKNKI